MSNSRRLWNRKTAAELLSDCLKKIFDFLLFCCGVRCLGREISQEWKGQVTQQNRVKPVPTYVYVREGFSYDS